MRYIKEKIMISLLLIPLLSFFSLARIPGPVKEKVQIQANQIQQMVEAGDVNGLIQMLSTGEFPSKVSAAEHLGEIGDERALPELEKLNEDNGGWVIREIHEYRSGAFAVAICKILTRNLSKEKQIEALFELLESKGSAVPASLKKTIAERTTVNGIVLEDLRKLYSNLNIEVGKRVAEELDKFDNPSIVPRLRQCENRGVSPIAVWMEVRDMAVEDAILRCMEIARDEGDEQRYGAIHCLSNFSTEAIDALNQLALEGFAEAITVLGNYKEDEKVFDLLCWHLTNNKNSLVRLRVISPIAFVQSDSFRLKSLQTLVQALYDPSERIRESAAYHLSTRAFKMNKSYFDAVEDSLLIALKHPDEKVREYILESLERLDCERLNEVVPNPPVFRTDLEEKSRAPLTAEQRLKAKTEPLEDEASKAMEKGPPEKAVTLYTELLELRPGYKPYQKALDLAKAYIDAAEQVTEQWYPDAPYIGIKGRYHYLLTNAPLDVNNLKETFDLALFLEGEYFPEWTNPFGKDPKGRDQSEKALKLFKHIVEHYPDNEYLVLFSKAEIGALNRNLYRDTESFNRLQIDISSMPVENVVDSTNEINNIPLAEQGGKTQTQLNFERYFMEKPREGN